MRKLLLALLLGIGAAGVASHGGHAACFGSGSFGSCTDSYGNSYTVNRFGNTTTMQGYNARTGSSWSQNSTTFGNSTVHNGLTNGRSWHMQQQDFGGMQTFTGTDSYGRPFSYTCGPFGCN